MGESVRTFTPVNQAQVALYIEGQRCPFSSLQLTYGDNTIPMLAGSIPALEVNDGTNSFSVRNIPPNSKVVVLYRNTLVSSLPRFEVRFIGELTSPGFTRSASDKSYQFRAQHFTHNLQGISLTALEPGAYLEEVIEGKQAEGANLEGIISGTIFEKFSPKVIAEGSGVAFDKLTIHDFVKESLKVYMARALKGPTRQAHPIQAAINYGIYEHLYTSSDSNTKMTWGRLYSLIMNYTYMDLIPKISGSKLSYLEMIQALCQLFLQNLDITPSPKHYNQTLIVKPDTIFLPPPACNVIYPIYATNYDYHEDWSSKATRLIQIQHPASGIEAPQLRQYYRTISPPALRKKFQEYQAATSDKERLAMDLTTEEEKRRNIVESFNELPSFISAAIQAVEDGNQTNETGGVKPTVLGTAAETQTAPTASSIDFAPNMTIDENKRRSIFNKAFLHEELLKMETNSSTIAPELFTAGSNKAISGKNQYVPQYIYLIDSTTAYTGGRNYEVGATGELTQKTGRYFHIFQEPTGLPLAIKFSKSRDGIKELKAARNPAFPDPFVYLDTSVDVATDSLNVNPLAASTDERPPLSSLEKSVSGGTHWGLVVVAPLTESSTESDEALARLLAILCDMCGFPATNVKTLSDEFGDTFSAKTGQGVTKLTGEVVKAKYQAKIAIATSKLYTEMDQAYTQYLKSIGAETSAPPPATTTNTKIKTASPVGATPIVPNWRVFIPKAGYKKLAQEQAAEPVSATNAPSVVKSPRTSFQALADIGGKEPGIALSNYLSTCTGLVRATYLWQAFAVYANDNRAGLIRGGDRSTQTPKTLLQAANRTKKVLDDQVTKKKELAAILANDESLKRLVVLVGLINGVLSSSDNRYISFFTEIQKLGAGVTSDRIVNTVLPKFQQELGQVTTFLATYPTQFRPESTALSDSEYINLQGTTGITNPTLEKLKADSKLDTPPTEVAGAVSVDELDSVDEKKIKFKTLQQFYIEPICDYYFYKNRHASSVSEIQMPFHPYITPGYSTLVVDGSAMQMHQYGYVSSVTHMFTPDSAWTTASLSYLRRADEELWVEYQLTALPNSAGQFPISPVEDAAQRTPFFSGEFSLGADAEGTKVVLDNTYQKLLGCPMYDVATVVEVAKSTPDYLTAIKANKRDIQTAQVIFPASDPLKDPYTAMYNKAPSKVQFKWNDHQFPQNLDMVTGILQPADYVTGARTRDHGDKFPWDAGVQAIIKLIWNYSITKGAYNG